MSSHTMFDEAWPWMLGAALLVACQSRSGEPAPSGVDSVEVPAAPKNAASSEPAPSQKPVVAKDLIEPLRRALHENDPDLLAKLAHPRGVRFSPYAHVDPKSDVVLSPAEIRGGFANDEPRRWGSFDGSGKPIQLDFEEYFKRFVSIPGAKQAQVAVDRVLGTGNTKNNLREVYPDATFIEFHHKGTDPKYEGMDWQSVRFVFSRNQGKLELIGVIHDQWTI